MVHVALSRRWPGDAWACSKATVQVGSVALPPAEPLIKDGQLRALAGHRRAALVLAAGGGRQWSSSAIRISSPTPSTRCSRPAGTPPRNRGAAGEGKPRPRSQRPEGARAGPQGSASRSSAGTPEQLAARVAAEVPAVRDPRHQGRHQDGVSEAERVGPAAVVSCSGWRPHRSCRAGTCLPRCCDHSSTTGRGRSSTRRPPRA